MTQRDDRVSLADMLSHSREAEELLGDAANRVSAATQQKYPEIPWGS